MQWKPLWVLRPPDFDLVPANRDLSRATHFRAFQGWVCTHMHAHTFKESACMWNQIAQWNAKHNTYFLFDLRHAMYYFDSFHSLKYRFTKIKHYTLVHLFFCPWEMNTILQKMKKALVDFPLLLANSLFFCLCIFTYFAHATLSLYKKDPESSSSCGRGPICSLHAFSKGN